MQCRLFAKKYPKLVPGTPFWKALGSLWAHFWHQMTIRRRFGRDLGRDSNFDVFLVRLTRFGQRGEGGGEAKRQFGSPTGRTTGGDEEESIHPTRLLTPRGRRINIYDNINKTPQQGVIGEGLRYIVQCVTLPA